MNNLTRFSDFVKGDPLKSEGKPIETASAEITNVEEDQGPTDAAAEMAPPDHVNKKFVKHYEKYFGKRKSHEELKGGDVNMKPFKHAYETTERQYTSLLRELNRIEASKPTLKKDVVELKKCFSDVLVKLQFFTEYKQPPEEIAAEKEAEKEKAEKKKDK